MDVNGGLTDTKTKTKTKTTTKTTTKNNNNNDAYLECAVANVGLRSQHADNVVMAAGTLQRLQFSHGVKAFRLHGIE